jgi:polyisoprenoid-binding protein YceI
LLRRSLLIVLLSLFVISPAQGAPLTFEIDTNHSNVSFAVPIQGLARVRGKFTDFSVTIVYDEADVTKSSVTARIKAASIDTGVERRDSHLRNPDFFDAEKFPDITFQSTRVEKKGKQFLAHGTFTMHGVAKEVVIPFTITGKHKDPQTGQTTLGVMARLSINRRDYGITWSNPKNPTFIGDQVDIELDLITRPGKA